MPRLYYVLTDERDNQKFQSFTLGSSVLAQSKYAENSPHVWGISSNTNQENWNEIKKNDVVFFGQKNSEVNYYGIVKAKKIDNSLAAKIWGASPRNKTLNHFLFFDNLYNTSINFHQILKYCGIKSDIEPFSGLHKIKNDSFFDFTHQIPKKERKQKISEKKTTDIPVDYDGPPGKDVGKVTRFIRDTAKSALLKKKYKDKCQVCGYAIEVSKNKRYSEVHHIFPLKDGGADNFNNMIVLCPTHHAEFDYRVIGISNDGKTVVDKKGKKIGILDIQNDHKLDKASINFHLEMMKKS